MMWGGAIRGLGAAGTDPCQYFMSLVALVGSSLQRGLTRLLAVCPLPSCDTQMPMQQQSKGENKSVRPGLASQSVSGEHGVVPPPTPPVAWAPNTARGLRLVGWGDVGGDKKRLLQGSRFTC